MSNEPRGEDRDDYRIGLMAFQLARQLNYQGDDPNAFVLRFTPPPAQISDPETAALVDDFFAM